MAFILCVEKKNRARVINTGDNVKDIAMIVAICKTVSEKIAEEKGITTDKAMRFLLKSIYDTEKSALNIL